MTTPCIVILDGENGEIRNPTGVGRKSRNLVAIPNKSPELKVSG